MAAAGPVSTITATFVLSTPAFIAGADGKVRAELRLPSVLGVLRWWWRALAWSRTEGADVAARLGQLHKWEAELFGAAAGADHGGQGRFLARLVPPLPEPAGRGHRPFLPKDKDKQVPTDGGWLRGSGRDYLTGQGLNGRHYFSNGAAFTIELRNRHRDGWSIAGSGAPSVIDAVEALGLLGGIGARTRRGFGSVRLQKLTIDGGDRPQPSTAGAYIEALGRLLASHAAPAADSAEVPYSAFSSLTRLAYVQAQSSDVAGLHDEMGHRLQYYRSYGFKLRNGTRIVGGRPLPGPPAVRPFENDHTWFGTVIGHFSDPSPPAGLAAPKRTVFGMPHNYFKRGLGGPDRLIHVTEVDTDRRASPLMLHIHRFTCGERPIAVWVMLPATFVLPRPGSGLTVAVTREQVTREGGEKVTTSVGTWSVPIVPDFSPIEDFLAETHVPGLKPVSAAAP